MPPEPGSVLIADDNSEGAVQLKDGLARKGYRVEVATTPGDALMIASLNRPDVVIMDVEATDADGSKLLPKLRAIDESLLVILVGGPDPKAFDWARKPVDVEILEPMVRRAVVFGRDRANRNVVVPFDLERRRASQGGMDVERNCSVCRGAVRAADTNLVLQAGSIYHAACWLKGRARAEQV